MHRVTAPRADHGGGTGVVDVTLALGAAVHNVLTARDDHVVGGGDHSGTGTARQGIGELLWCSLLFQ